MHCRRFGRLRRSATRNDRRSNHVGGLLARNVGLFSCLDYGRRACKFGRPPPVPFLQRMAECHPHSPNRDGDMDRVCWISSSVVRSSPSFEMMWARLGFSGIGRSCAERALRVVGSIHMRFRGDAADGRLTPGRLSAERAFGSYIERSGALLRKTERGGRPGRTPPVEDAHRPWKAGNKRPPPHRIASSAVSIRRDIFFSS